MIRRIQGGTEWVLEVLWRNHRGSEAGQPLTYLGPLFVFSNVGLLTINSESYGKF